MTLWTIQPCSVWEQARADGVVHVDPKYYWNGVPFSQYVWLAEQLRRKVGFSAGCLPWWAYCKRPDLRTHRYTQRGHRVLLELVPPEGEFLSFPIWAWAKVFSGHYLSVSAEDEASWNALVYKVCGAKADELKMNELPPELTVRLRQSWERLFASDLPARSWQRGHRSKDREAVLEEIRIDWVRSVRHFRGLRKSKW